MRGDVETRDESPETLKRKPPGLNPRGVSLFQPNYPGMMLGNELVRVLRITRTSQLFRLPAGRRVMDVRPITTPKYLVAPVGSLVGPAAAAKGGLPRGPIAERRDAGCWPFHCLLYRRMFRGWFTDVRELGRG